MVKDNDTGGPPLHPWITDLRVDYLFFTPSSTIKQNFHGKVVEISRILPKDILIYIHSWQRHNRERRMAFSKGFKSFRAKTASEVG